jgi:hypothetical protein
MLSQLSHTGQAVDIMFNPSFRAKDWGSDEMGKNTRVLSASMPKPSLWTVESRK